MVQQTNINLGGLAMLVSPWILPPIDSSTLPWKKGGWKTILSPKTRSSTRVELWTVGGINTKQLWNYQIINPHDVYPHCYTPKTVPHFLLQVVPWRFNIAMESHHCSYVGKPSNQMDHGFHSELLNYWRVLSLYHSIYFPCSVGFTCWYTSWYARCHYMMTIASYRPTRWCPQ